MNIKRKIHDNSSMMDVSLRILIMAIMVKIGICLLVSLALNAPDLQLRVYPQRIAIFLKAEFILEM